MPLCAKRQMNISTRFSTSVRQIGHASPFEMDFEQPVQTQRWRHGSKATHLGTSKHTVDTGARVILLERLFYTDRPTTKNDYPVRKNSPTY